MCEILVRFHAAVALTDARRRSIQRRATSSSRSLSKAAAKASLVPRFQQRQQHRAMPAVDFLDLSAKLQCQFQIHFDWFLAVAGSTSAISSNVGACHIRTVASPLPVKMVWPSGDHTSDWTTAECPRKVATSCPRATFHNFSAHISVLSIESSQEALRSGFPKRDLLIRTSRDDLAVR